MGDEVNGIAVVSQFLQWCIDSCIENTMTGRLTIIPVLNISGFAHMQRYVFEDWRDLNRCFGVKGLSSFSEYTAQCLLDSIYQYCDYGIDVHDSGGRWVLIPHPRFHACTDSHCDMTTRRMAELFDSLILLPRDWHKNMLAVAVNRLYKKPLLTLEVGGEQKLYQKWYDDVQRGIRNIMTVYGLLPWVPDLRVKKHYVLDTRYGFKTPRPGIISLTIWLGDKVCKGDVVWRFFDPMRQEWEDIVCPLSGLVFSVWGADQIPKRRIMYSVLEYEW